MGSIVVPFGLVTETHYHIWWCGAWATIPEHNPAGRSARRGASLGESLDRGRDFRARAAARPSHRLRHGLPDAAPAGGARVDPGINVRGSSKPVRRTCRKARSRALPGVRSPPGRRRPGRSDGASCRGGTERIRREQPPHGLLRALPRVQERGVPAEGRSAAATGAEWRRVDPAKRGNLELRIRFKGVGEEPTHGR